jgi:hypothetical protein
MLTHCMDGSRTRVLLVVHDEIGSQERPRAESVCRGGGGVQHARWGDPSSTEKRLRKPNSRQRQASTRLSPRSVAHVPGALALVCPYLSGNQSPAIAQTGSSTSTTTVIKLPALGVPFINTLDLRCCIARNFAAPIQERYRHLEAESG